MVKIPETISNLIESQFPEIYRDEGPNFVAFVKAYYEWLEQNHQLIRLESNEGFEVGSIVKQENVTGVVIAIIDGELLIQVSEAETFKCFNVCSELIPVTTVNKNDGKEYSSLISQGGTSKRLGVIFQARNLLSYRDIDQTIDLFIAHFKEKYLRNIEFDTVSNKRLLIKNSLNLYRSKGTERAIDLFFRLVYGVNASVKRPADFLFQASASEWYKPTYLEISPNTVEKAIQMIGKELKGVTSGSKAFVEKYVKIKTSSGFSHVLFVSNIKGLFKVGELISASDDLTDAPTIYGSLGSLSLTTNTFTFKVGDIVPLKSSTGINALGRVVEVRFATGQVEYELEDGGYGYTVNFGLTGNDLVTRTITADSLLTFSDVAVGNVISGSDINNPGIGYSNGNFLIYPSDVGRSSVGTITTDAAGAIVKVTIDDHGTGYTLQFNPDPVAQIVGSGSGALIRPTFDYPREYFSLLSKFDDTTNVSLPTAEVLASSPEVLILNVELPVGNFLEDDIIFQTDPDLGIIASGRIVRTNLTLQGGTITLTDIVGYFRPNTTLKSSRPGSVANFTSLVNLQVSVKYKTEDRFLINSTYINTQSGFSGVLQASSAGTNANYFVTGIDSVENITVNSDLLSSFDLSDIALDSVSFNLPANPTANLMSDIFSSLSFVNLDVGRIRTIGGFNPGNNYSVDPKTLTIQPFISGFQKKDIVLEVSDISGSFITGELITQNYNEPTISIKVTDAELLTVGDIAFSVNLEGDRIAEGTISRLVNSTTIELVNSTGSFSVGSFIRSQSNQSWVREIIGLESFDALVSPSGKLKAISEKEIVIERLSFTKEFKEGVNVAGSASGQTAMVVKVNEDPTSKVLGLNSSVIADSITSDGTVTEIQVVDSGFGFSDGQEGTFESKQGRRGTFRAINTGIGTGSGEYRSLKGFASDESKLFDGDYYQEYSYDIISSIPLEKYSDMFKKVLHTSGTRFFGSVLIDSQQKISSSVRSETGSSSIEIANTSPFIIHSINIFNAPEPWGSTTTNPELLDDVVPVDDRSDINIEVRG